jgi:hypothetical protein
MHDNRKLATSVTRLAVQGSDTDFDSDPRQPFSFVAHSFGTGCPWSCRYGLVRSPWE